MKLQYAFVGACASLATLGIGSVGHAATIASDKASNSTYTTSYAGLNGGSGFGAWTVSADAGGSNGIGASTSGSGVLNFLVGETGTTVGTTIDTATRPLIGTLSSGQTFSTDTTLGSAGGGALLGFSLEDSSGNILFDAHATGGGNQYVYSDKTVSNTNINGVHYNFGVTDTFAFSLLDTAGDYSLTVSSTNTGGNGVTGGTSTTTGTITNTAGIAKVVYYNNASGFANGEQMTNLSVTPEPASLGILGMAALAMLRRRRRS